MGAGGTADDFERTWDGEPISKEPPFGAAVVVYRRLGAEADAPLAFLVLHRGQQGPDYEGEWAWGPPAGARHPGEPIAACAARELLEETGMRLPLLPTGVGTDDWPVYLAEASTDAAVVLSAEHDRYAWLPLDPAATLVSPERVRDSFLAAAALVPVERAGDAGAGRVRLW